MRLPTTRDLVKLPHLYQVRYALYAATKVAHLTKLPQAATCLRVVEAYLAGKASKEDCRVAANAAAENAAYYAAKAACAITAEDVIIYADYAAWFAYFITDSSFKLELIADLRRYYEELLNFDAIADQYLLGV